MRACLCVCTRTCVHAEKVVLVDKGQSVGLEGVPVQAPRYE